MHHAFQLGQDEHELWLSRDSRGYVLHLGVARLHVALRRDDDGSTHVTVGDSTVPVHVVAHGDEVFVHVDGATHALRYRHPMERLAAAGQASSEDVIRAPMPGSVVQLPVKAGDTVARGDTLLVIESMKMETTLTAPRDGVVETVHVEKGQTFDRDALLVTLEGAS